MQPCNVGGPGSCHALVQSPPSRATLSPPSDPIKETLDRLTCVAAPPPNTYTGDATGTGGTTAIRAPHGVVYHTDANPQDAPRSLLGTPVHDQSIVSLDDSSEQDSCDANIATAHAFNLCDANSAVALANHIMND